MFDAHRESIEAAEFTDTADTITWETGGEQFSDKELVDELTTHAAHLAVAECHYVLLVAELDRRDLWGNLGARSCAHWLNWRCGTSLGTAREQVHVGRALASLPAVRGAFASGEISYSKARAITRIATPKTEKQLVEWARLATASQLELIVRSYRRVETDEGRTALAKHRQRYVRTYTDDNGMIVIHARLSPEDGAVVLGAIEAARDALRADRQGEPNRAPGGAVTKAPDETPEKKAQDKGSDVPAETSSEDAALEDAETTRFTGDPDRNVSAATLPEERDVVDPPKTIPTSKTENPLALVGEGPGDDWGMANADALVEVCRSVLANGLSSGDDKPSVGVTLHVDEKILENPGAEGCSHIEGVGAVSSHTARRLACDAGITPLIYRIDGRVEAEGKTRSIPKKMRRAVLARDGGCRWPGCTRRRFVDVHHVVFWSNGGRTKPSNLVTICRFHHRLVHEGGYRLESRPSGQVQVWRPDGAEIPFVPPRIRARGAGIAEQHRQAGLPIDTETLAVGYAEPFDVDTTTEWLFWLSKE